MQTLARERCTHGYDIHTSGQRSFHPGRRIFDGQAFGWRDSQGAGSQEINFIGVAPSSDRKVEAGLLRAC